MNGPATPLLGESDPPPVSIRNPAGTSPFLLIGDHAGVAAPAALDSLGVPAAEMRRHIALDLGIAELGPALAERLDAPFIAQTYSRLVIDCNRDPAAPDAIPMVSDGTPIPANAALTPAARAARAAAIHAPYQAAIAAALDARAAAGRPTILIALHSFTPIFGGIARPWRVGVLHDGGDTRYAHALLARLRARHGDAAGDNEPYRMALIDHTVPRHAYPRRLPYAEVEVRQDLLADDGAITAMADALATDLTAAAAGLPVAGATG